NFNAGQTVPNLVIAKVGAGGWISIYNRLGDTHVVVDVMGWFSTTDTQGLAAGASETSAVDINGAPVTGDVSGVSGDGRYSLFTTGAGTVSPHGSAPQGGLFVRDSVLGITTEIAATAATPGSSVAGAGLTADGRYALWTTSEGLVPPDTNGADDVYVSDLATGYIFLLSYKPTSQTTGVVGNQRSQALAISPNGSYVTFVTMSTNLATGTTGTGDLVVQDESTGATTRVAAWPAGVLNDRHGHQTVADTGDVVFSEAPAPGGVSQVYVWRSASKTSTLVSQPTGTSGTGGAAGSWHPAISGNGRYVSFTSQAALDPKDTNGADDVYLRDTTTNTTTLVSVNAAGTAAGNGASNWSSISTDGSAVAYQSVAKDLVASPAVTGTFPQVFRWVRTSGTTTLVSAAGGAAANAQAVEPIINSSGTFVGYATNASNLVPGAVANWQGVLTRAG
ncbi:MAG TPA: hypothetical protein VFP72_13380, partial [Kineosporiaceae bacterium]|nr:hypothetical protein [Kineosporiaceae bacterium]